MLRIIMRAAVPIVFELLDLSRNLIIFSASKNSTHQKKIHRFSSSVKPPTFGQKPFYFTERS